MTDPRKLTSREAYHRIVWDTRLNRDAFAVVYADRKAPGGTRLKPLARWDPAGDIPWHRVVSIRCGPLVVWARGTGLFVADEHLPPTAWTPPGDPNAPDVRPRPVFAAGPRGWSAIASLPDNVILTRLTVATWNVLPDGPGLAELADRIPLILGELRRRDADVIALQAVAPRLGAAILELAGERGWFVSEPAEATGLTPHGPLLLSRMPFALAERAFSTHERALIGTWSVNGRPLHVACVHLSSPEAAERERQFVWLLDHLRARSGAVVVAGDLNTTADEWTELTSLAGFADVWTTLRPNDPGSTVEPTRNRVTAAVSSRGQFGRVDRLLWCDPADGWKPAAVRLFADVGPEFASDHFGLSARWELSPPDVTQLTQTRPVYETALAVVPPEEIWPPIQEIRHAFDSKADRWMPHVNLVYGFVPEDQFPAAAAVLQAALAEMPPFEVVLTSYDTFRHRRGCTAWLRPETNPPGALTRLQAVMERLFPLCDEQRAKSPSGFVPHLSVGRFGSVGEARELLPPWQPLRFFVESLALVSRRGEEPFAVRSRVPLGGIAPISAPTVRESESEALSDGRASDRASSRTRTPRPLEHDDAPLLALIDQLAPTLTAHDRERGEAARSALAALAETIVGRTVAIHPAGSWRMGVASPDSDLDCVCLLPPRLPRLTFLRRLRDRLAADDLPYRLADGAKVPVLRTTLAGVPVDVLAANARHSDLPPTGKNTGFDPESWTAILGCLEPDAVLREATRVLPETRFRQLVRAVRAWAKARRLHGNAWGLLGGFTWSLLTAWAVRADPPEARDGTGTILATVFQSVAAHRWGKPAAITPAGRRYRPRRPRERLPVVTPLEPCRNSARNVTRSTSRLLRREWERAARVTAKVLAGEATWDALFAPADLLSQSERFIAVTALAADEEFAGLLEGRILGLVLDLERDLDADVRPWPNLQRQSDGSARAVLGLNLAEGTSHREVIRLGRLFADKVAEEFGGGRLTVEFLDRSALADA